MSENNTNGRTRMMQVGLALLDRLSPLMASHVAESLFRTPPRRPPLNPKSRAFLSSARRRWVRLGNHRLAVYTWGHGPLVYLLHGWAGRTTQFHALVPALVEAGYQVVSLDAAGHGLSVGRSSSLAEFRDSLMAVVRATSRGRPVRAVIAHSMGGAAAALALAQGLRVGRVVMIAPPRDPRHWLGVFRERTGLSERTVGVMAERMARRLGARWSDMDVPSVGATLSTPLLVFHDHDDEDVPWENGAAIAEAWPGAELVSTVGLGHSKILRDPGVIRSTLDFLQASYPVCQSCGRSLPDPASIRCEGCHVDLELFERDHRWARQPA